MSVIWGVLWSIVPDRVTPWSAKVSTCMPPEKTSNLITFKEKTLPLYAWNTCVSRSYKTFGFDLSSVQGLGMLGYLWYPGFSAACKPRSRVTAGMAR